ncbi:hemerythrin HHE cation binding domain-containing protein [Mycobacteroides abscessus subsp. abscessus]|nr:hemerythrin HHE cation binding domain-containing protein [Mycobacteroides abscessus subsp. abscessus]
MTDRQMFKLVDANTVPSEDGGCGCGCGGEGKKERAEQAAPEQAPAAQTAEQGGCGCGGHGHGAEAAEAPAEHAGCGCGDGAPSAGNVHAGGAGVIHRPGADELVIHSIPRVVRHAVLFAAVDNLPVGENIQICAPHQPEPLFAHLQDSEQHYRVETLEVGPVDWRYRITRLA